MTNALYAAGTIVVTCAAALAACAVVFFWRASVGTYHRILAKLGVRRGRAG